MGGERNTPLGTPVVIAPGKIPLIGEYAVVEEGFAVVAAITRHAKAQFVPRADTMPRLIAELVKRAQIEVGEVSAALPLGSVVVNDDDFRDNTQMVGLGLSAATAVATVGAVFETLGLPIQDRQAQICAVADAGRRMVQGQVGSGADALAATYGGLVQITRAKGAVPQVHPLTPPPGLRIVLFSAGPSISPHLVVDGMKTYAKSDPVGFDGRILALRDLARRFVDEANSGRATGALSAAGKYGDELASLTVAAQVPIVTDAFAHATELARELGGVAKPTGAGGGEIGVGLFATPEAADLFRKACPEFLRLLDGDLDRLGVRCQETASLAENWPTEIASFPTPLPEPNPIEISLTSETATVQELADDIDTVPTAIASEPTPPHGTPSRGIRRRILPAGVVAAAMLLVAWFALPGPVRARLHLRPPRIGGARPSSAESFTPPSPRPSAAIPPPVVPAPSEPGEPANIDSPDLVDNSTPQPDQSLATKRDRKNEIARPSPASSRKQPHAVAGPGGTIGTPAARAGRISLDDF